MSALELHKFSRSESRSICCANMCERLGGSRGVSYNRIPTHRVFLCGYPAGDYCGACVKAWQQLFTAEYHEPVSDEPEVPA